MNYLAQTINLGPKGGFRGFGALGLENTDAWQAFFTFNNIISTTIGIISVVGMIWFTVNILLGAVSIIGSGGDKQKMEAARNKITSSIIGVVVVIAGVFLIDLVGSLIGISPLKGVYNLFPNDVPVAP